MTETTQGAALASKLNWLRAAVLGANDGIVSIAGLVLGVSGAKLTGTALFLSGMAGVVAGALSMAAGEYVSVSTQRDAERAELTKEAEKQAEDPDGELAQLTALITEKGVEPKLAHEVAAQLTERDALAAHAHWHLGIDPEALTDPWHAAIASMIAFALGAFIPLAAIVLTPSNIAIPVTVIAVVISLAITGSTAAKLGGAPVFRPTIRNILGGMFAMGISYYIGALISG